MDAARFAVFIFCLVALIVLPAVILFPGIIITVFIMKKPIYRAAPSYLWISSIMFTFAVAGK